MTANQHAAAKSAKPDTLLALALTIAVLTSSTLCASLSQASEPPVPFTANMEFLRNGKLIGEATFSFEVNGSEWVLRSEMAGTRGVAKFLGVRENSESIGQWIDGSPRPERFQQTVKVSIKTVETRGVFDWEQGTVLSVHEDGETTLPLTPGILDPVSVGLAVRSGLGTGLREWHLPMVDEDEIEEQHFRAEGAEALDTALGCLQTERVDKIRAASSTRYTRTWYAEDYDWIPVHVAHGKTDGDQMETRLVSLVVDGQTIEKAPACGA
ncbi:MAG: DUF3108 domain-containing protein [Pseudomonadota bacterium]